MNDPRIIERAFREGPGAPVTVPSQKKSVKHLCSALTDALGARFLFEPGEIETG